MGFIKPEYERPKAIPLREVLKCRLVEALGTGFGMSEFSGSFREGGAHKGAVFLISGAANPRHRFASNPRRPSRSEVTGHRTRGDLGQEVVLVWSVRVPPAD